MKLIFTILFSFLFLNANPFEEKTLNLYNTTQTTATIKIGSLVIGQSGIIIHKFKNNKSTILTDAIVTNSNKLESTIEFLNTTVLKQTAIPTTNLNPSNDDKFVLNHLWTTSLLLTPNFESKQRIKKAYYNNNFIDTDIFAAWLKINNTPVPKKEDIQKFTSYNNIGSIFIQAGKKLYIIDAVSFKVIQERDILIKSEKVQVPFFSNVQDIEKSTFSWFSPAKIDNYNEYYTNLLGINNDR
ncbi:MAG TPA: hypothetical protein EYG97_00490 [Arcobacter sp.]|nr:hypothetical protein [Arcobacter sp.]